MLAQAQREDVAPIRDELHHLDNLIYPLLQARAGLLRRMNNVQATTRHLPTELLAIIFQYARPPIDFSARTTQSNFPHVCNAGRHKYGEEDFQLVLGAVSSHWRQVVWSTPQLWTTLSIEVHQARCNNNASLLNLYFKNSRTLPMTIELDLRAQLYLLECVDDAEERAKCISILEPIKTSVFVDNATKIQNFILTGLPIEWVPVIQKNLSQCKSITLCWPPSHTIISFNRVSVNLTDLFSLRSVRVEGLSTPLLLPWSMITALRLCDMSIGRCLELLIKCPNLVNFEVSRPHQIAFTDSESLPLLNRPILLEHLESLGWHTTPGKWCSAFLRHVRFSKLRVLQLSGVLTQFGHPDMQPLFTSFVSRLPSTLQTLKLTGVNYSFSVLKDFLASVPHVRTVHITESSCDTIGYMLGMIGHPPAGLRKDTMPGWVIIDPHKSDGPKILPFLRTFVLDSKIFTFRLGQIAIMLEALHNAGPTHECFRLELKSDNDLSLWTPEILARLQKLAMAGFKLEVIYGSRILDYMALSRHRP